MNEVSGDRSPDSQDRIDDFLVRHGGAGTRPARVKTHEGGLAGVTEVYAADGYVLLCEWSVAGTRKEMKFSELPPVTQR